MQGPGKPACPGNREASLLPRHPQPCTAHLLSSQRPSSAHPENPNNQADDLKRLHEDALKRDPFISRAVGPKAKIERMRAGSLRIGSQGECVCGGGGMDSRRGLKGREVQ